MTLCGGACVPTGAPSVVSTPDAIDLTFVDVDCSSPCGTCALPHALSTCSGTTCAIASCEPGWADCNHVASDGCEADLHSAATCGACGATCSGSTPLCAAGSCVASCAPPLSSCTDRCTDLSTDPYNCGSCTACTASAGFPTCAGGQCGPILCPPGTSECPAYGSCIPLNGPAHCGSCGNNCPAPTGGFAVCTAGQCGMACQPGWTLKGSACTTPASTLAVGGTSFEGLSLDANNVYWVDSSAGTVNAVAKSGGTVRVLAQNQSNANVTAVDDSYAYWSNSLDIMRTPKDGSGSPSVLVAGVGPTDLVVIGDSVYWLQSYGIERAPKGGGGVPVSIGDFGGDAGIEKWVDKLSTNGTYLLAQATAATFPYAYVVDPSSGSVVTQVQLLGMFPRAGIDSNDIDYNFGGNCPGVSWTSLPGDAGPNGSVFLYSYIYDGDGHVTHCGNAGMAAILLAGNRCNVFCEWGMVSKAQGAQLVPLAASLTNGSVPDAAAPDPMTSLVADDHALFVSTATTITRVDLP